MVVQVNYSQVHKPWHLGQVADGRLFNSMNGLPSEDLPWGAGVIRDPNDNKKIALPTTALQAQGFIGIIMYELNRALLPEEGEGVPRGYDCTVVTQGDVAVFSKQAVVAGDPVYLIYDAANRGNFRKDDGGGVAQLLIGWEWKFVTGADDVGVIGVKANVAAASQTEVEANDTEIAALDGRVTTLENAGG